MEDRGRSAERAFPDRIQGAQPFDGCIEVKKLTIVLPWTTFVGV
jgi:hypothetical protein